MQEQSGEEQSVSLLRTKFYIPTIHQNLIRRQRLIDLLQSNLKHDGQFSRRLTLISAPAGYGKTTLVSQWLGVAELPAAWLTLEPAENDPTRFLLYVLAALRTVSPHIGTSAMGMLQAPQKPPQEIILTNLINDLAQYDGALLLVMDDYHVIQSVQNHEVLNFLVEHLPSNMHLVITSREDPPLPLHRLQARRQMLSVRQSDLCFLIEEVVEFFRSGSDFELTKGEAELLTRRTEGWITGLQLAALSMKAVSDRKAFIHSFTGSNRYILDYLFEEVFETQSQEMKDFLLKTSILDRICAELADELTQQTESQAILEQLEQSNFFIVPLDQSRHWYRYHRLFVDLLRHRLGRTSQDQSRLHELASRWYTQHDFLEEAVEHAIAGEHWTLAGEQIEAASEERLRKGELNTLLRWYRQVPESVILSRPDWALSYAWPLILIGEVNEARRILKHLKQMEIPPGHILHGHIAAAEAFLSRSSGDMEKTIEFSKQALKLLPDDDFGSRAQLAVNLGLNTWHLGRLDEAEGALQEALNIAHTTDNQYLHHTALVFMARCAASRGDFHQATVYLDTAEKIGDRLPTAVLAYCDIAEILFGQNRLDRAWDHLHKAKAIAEAVGNQEFLTACCIQEALFNLNFQDLEAAQVALAPALEISRVDDFPLLTRARIQACHVQLAIAQGEIKLAREIYAGIPIPHDAGTYTRFIDFNQARLLLAENEIDKAKHVLYSIVQQTEKMGWGYGGQIARIMLAQAESDRDRSVEHLESALEAFEPQGIIRPFLHPANRLAPLLQEASRRGIMTSYIGKILAEPVSGERADSLIDGRYEPLSDRELEVLRLVATGQSNRQVAEQLVVSVGTAKAHLHHIFNKLDVSNRTEAVSKARQLGLL